MSGLEIERKFLVKKGDAYKSAAFSSSHIQQGYIPAEGATVRVRTRDEKAYLTIKGKSVNGGMTRYEFEKEITMDEAQHLLQLCQGGVIDKRRYLVKSGSHTFEVDEFYGDNEGLVMAEVELASETEAYEKQKWAEKEESAEKIVREAGCTITELTPEAYAEFQAAMTNPSDALGGKSLYEKYGADYQDVIDAITAVGEAY